VNRPLNFRRGWLGDLPLTHFEPGSHVIHGVPFEILGGPSRRDGGALVFRSSVNRTGNKHQLPERCRIPVRSRAAAVYVLHGCGFANDRQSFATYTFGSHRQKLGSVELVTLGDRPRGDATEAERTPEPNIQDWWSDFPQQDFEHARMAPILISGETAIVHRHAYLYTLEWLNPHPEQQLSYLDIAVNALRSTTLGVLAVTVIKP
jgi:hypothetical protein